MTGVVVLLLAAGVVVSATAAPGPSTDVKTAQYGGPTPKGPCKKLGGEPASTCQLLQDEYLKAKRACKRKRGKARARCLKRVERNEGRRYKEFLR